MLWQMRGLLQQINCPPQSSPIISLAYNKGCLVKGPLFHLRPKDQLGIKSRRSILWSGGGGADVFCGFSVWPGRLASGRRAFLHLFPCLIGWGTHGLWDLPPEYHGNSSFLISHTAHFWNTQNLMPKECNARTNLMDCISIHDNTLGLQNI